MFHLTIKIQCRIKMNKCNFSRHCETHTALGSWNDTCIQGVAGISEDTL